MEYFNSEVLFPWLSIISQYFFHDWLSLEFWMHCCVFFQDVEIKEEGTKHMLILYNVRMDMAGGVDFSAANAKSNAQLRVKGESTFPLYSFIYLYVKAVLIFHFIHEGVYLRKQYFSSSTQLIVIQKKTFLISFIFH